MDKSNAERMKKQKQKGRIELGNIGVDVRIQRYEQY